ncbi:MAG: phage integrase family protein [Phyllobacteriaceae bacterium]|nr:phage integrase family protein [Phyllobacteriaceae bacterium]
MNRPKRLLKYVKAYVDRHGKARYYTRCPGLPAVALPGVPWSPEFMAAHAAATDATKKPPITSALRASLETVPGGQLLFVVTARGKPYGGSAFSVFVKDAAAAAGLPADCTAHGLRKSMTYRLAEAGCSAPEIMSITGHSLKEAQRYIDEVDRARLATAAMKRVGASLGEKREQKVSNSNEG